MKAELMSVHFAHKSNKQAEVADFVQDVKVGANKTGIVVYFKATEKYVEVDVLYFNGRKIISITPSFLEEGPRLINSEDHNYHKHPDYYEIHIQIKTDEQNYVGIVTPLKHEYFVNFIPINNLCDYDVI